MFSLAPTLQRRAFKGRIESLNGVSLSVRRDSYRGLQIAIVFVVRPIWLFRDGGDGLRC